MGLFFSLIMFMQLLFILSPLHLLTSHSSPFKQPLCHNDERSALLQFKEGFVITISASNHYPLTPTCEKVKSWTVEGDKSDCCSWDGVECDEDTGHAIVLDLSHSCLYGSINSSSSLFRLVHLQRLNLADNHFNYSSIPSQVSNLSRLTYLNLANSMFSGQIALEISQLSNLSTLDLSRRLFSRHPSLELKGPSLFGNLARLQRLHLGGVNISSMMPKIFSNLSSLMSLSLHECGLHGEFPIGIFKLPNLQVLDVSFNGGLIGYLPDFTWRSSLESLNLQTTGFSGELPTSIGNLSYLTELEAIDSNFSGSIPSSLGNLNRLSLLDLSRNNFSGEIPIDLFNNLTQLTSLSLSSNKLQGPIPSSIENLVLLSYIDLSYNQFTSLTLSEHVNLTRLTHLTLLDNKIEGQIPNAIFNLTNLQSLDLSMNNFSGTVDFDKFGKLKYLTDLFLSDNQVTILGKETGVNVTLQKFRWLELSSCNLRKFPNFLRNQDKLESLELSGNNIHGQVPEWMWNTSTSLLFLDLSHNFLTGFGQHQTFLPWTSLINLRITSNLLRGSLPIPPVSIEVYSISDNSLTGNIPELFCDLTSVKLLDLANNNLSGSLPQCLNNFGDSLVVLDLHKNNFWGSIPQTWTSGKNLLKINLGQNKFQGQLPRSWANCTFLDVLDINDNQFSETFPSWLGDLPNLKVLILRSNKFHGPIDTAKSVDYNFPKLQIIDLSHNGFTGKLPLELFGNWKSEEFGSGYIFPYAIDYGYSTIMLNKGVNLSYPNVQNALTILDISSNKFVGEIPKSVENLKGFIVLNFAKNLLTGHIPSSLGNLVELESLDLSQNQFSGEIPQELKQLTFLAFFNVSYNHLTGPIPQGNQFDTFESKSFLGNSGLCGKQLKNKCENFDSLPLPPSIFEDSQDSRFPLEFGWKIVLVGYGFGFVFGISIGHIVIARKPGVVCI